MKFNIVMGNKPSTNISIIVVQKCTELSDISVRLQEASEVLMKEIYVDNVFVTGPDKQSLNSSIKSVEEISSASGFEFIEWMILKHISAKEKIVPIHSYADVERALGLY